MAAIVVCDLYLLTHAGDGDVEHLAVFGDGAAGYFVAFVVEDIHKVFVRKGVAFILIIDALLEYGLNLVARHLLA